MPIAPGTTSLRYMKTSLQSRTGSIKGTYVTGVETTTKTGGHGRINATILPDHALPERAYMTTSTSAGDTMLRVLPPIIDPYYRINPLNNTHSEHSSGSGDLLLTYPWEWRGTALGLLIAGNVSIAGPGFDTVLTGDHLVVGRNSRKGGGLGSRLEFSTDTGFGKLVVES